jgi:hypothetical protein
MEQTEDGYKETYSSTTRSRPQSSPASDRYGELLERILYIWRL